MCQTITKTESFFHKKLNDSLESLQHIPSPVFVTPLVRSVEWGDSQRKYSLSSADLISREHRLNIIYGSPESGKTVYLNALAANINKISAKVENACLGIYVDLASIRNKEIEGKILSTINDHCPSASCKNQSLSYLICVDRIDDSNTTNIEVLKNLANKNTNWYIVACISNNTLFDILLSQSNGTDIGFYELMPWGPSRIKEFAKKYLSGTTVDIDAAVRFVCTSLTNTDLPSTPVIVTLYLNVFRLIGYKLSSLSFLELLEQYESLRFMNTNNSAENSLYNKRKLLATIAANCTNIGYNPSIDVSIVKELTTEYFTTKLLSVDVDEFIDQLIKSGILRLDGTSISFRYYVFFDYYLARAFNEGILQVDQYLSSLPQCLAVSDALALYGGLFRENTTLAEQVIDLLEKRFQDRTEYHLCDLDKHIDDLLLEQPDSISANDIVANDINTKFDYQPLDMPYQESRNAYTASRERVDEAIDTNSQIEDIEVMLDSLKAIYNILRNLENIGGTDKLLFLDAVLDYHIRCNMLLIDFLVTSLEDDNKDLQTILAYMATMFSQSFISANLGSQGLELAISELIGQCNNDFKELILIFLSCDLRMKGYERRLKTFIEKTDSRAAIEMIYCKLRELFLFYDKRDTPVDLIAAFSALWEKRLAITSGKSMQGALKKGFGYLLDQMKKERNLYKMQIQEQ